MQIGQFRIAVRVSVRDGVYGKIRKGSSQQS